MSCVQCAELFAVGGSVEVTVAADWRNVFQPDESFALRRCQIAESGGPREELPCSTVALAPTEPLAKSNLDRVRCGAPLGLGRISAAGRRPIFCLITEFPASAGGGWLRVNEFPQLYIWFQRTLTM